jgi:hypothetical protein
LRSLAAAVLFGVATVLVVVAIPTQYWMTSYDGTGSHGGLWTLCWTTPDPPYGAVLECQQLDWVNTQNSFRGKGVLSEPPDVAAAKWGFLLGARGCIIGAAGVFALATAFTAAAVAFPRFEHKRIWHALAVTAAGLGVGAVGGAAGCFAYLQGKWSQYKYTELVLGPSWIIAIVAGGIAAVAVAGLVLYMIQPALCLRPASAVRESVAIAVRKSVELVGAVKAGGGGGNAVAGTGAKAPEVRPPSAAVTVGATSGGGGAGRVHAQQQSQQQLPALV